MENPNVESQDTMGDKVKAWLEDNLRILLSILIVIAIAGGIYSYSQRSQSPTITEVGEEEMIAEAPTETTENTDVETQQEAQPETEAPAETETTAPQDQQVTSTETSRETETSFIEAAQRGEGTTHLARRALANYLEKNPDSALTAEHKIYIEDYLRKNSGRQGGLAVGSSVEFSKDAIRGAIEKSKQLNDAQLQNLKKYSARVASL
jgi:hypothetical protein